MMNVKTILTALSIVLMSVTVMAQKTVLKAGETLNPGEVIFSKNGKWALSGRSGQFRIIPTNNFVFEQGLSAAKFKIGKDTGKSQKLILTANSITLNDNKSGGLIVGAGQGSPTYKYTDLIVEDDGSIGIYGSDCKTRIRMKHIQSSNDF